MKVLSISSVSFFQLIWSMASSGLWLISAWLKTYSLLTWNFIVLLWIYPMFLLIYIIQSFSILTFLNIMVRYCKQWIYSFIDRHWCLISLFFFQKKTNFSTANLDKFILPFDAILTFVWLAQYIIKWCSVITAYNFFFYTEHLLVLFRLLMWWLLCLK